MASHLLVASAVDDVHSHGAHSWWDHLIHSQSCREDHKLEQDIQMMNHTCVLVEMVEVVLVIVEVKTVNLDVLNVNYRSSFDRSHIVDGNQHFRK